ncbi:hypothetical protein ACFWWT_27390 [Streptomyces sp. NPDC058676]
MFRAGETAGRVGAGDAFAAGCLSAALLADGGPGHADDIPT